MTKPRTHSTPLAFLALFPEFKAPSWDGWRAVLARLTPNVKEFFAVVGRGAGKSRIVAVLACAFAARQYTRASGERIFVGVFGPDRKQAGITFRYIVGLMRSVPTLAALIESQTREALVLTNGVTIEVISATIAAPRGRSYALAIVEEAAFLPNETSANPDLELLRALRPALARVPGSLLAVVSSPYSRKGVLWQAYQRYHDQADGEVVLVQAETLALNPTFDARAVERALEEDPASARAEFFAEFRTDIESFIDPAAITAVTVAGRRQLPPDATQSYYAFADPAGGSGGDSFTMAVAHVDRAGRAVLDLVFEQRPPFSPEATVETIAHAIRPYGITLVEGDRYAGEWPREQFTKHAVTYWPSSRPKSDIYRDTLPLINSGRVELLDLPRLKTQLAGLERRTGHSGRDSIDHSVGGHEDVANSVCGALLQAFEYGADAGARPPVRATPQADAERQRLLARAEELSRDPRYGPAREPPPRREDPDDAMDDDERMQHFRDREGVGGSATEMLPSYEPYGGMFKGEEP